MEVCVLVRSRGIGGDGGGGMWYVRWWVLCGIRGWGMHGVGGLGVAYH